MKCLKCGRELVPDASGTITIDEMKGMHTAAHTREDLEGALAVLERKEHTASTKNWYSKAEAYAEAIALIRKALKPPKFEEEQ